MTEGRKLEVESRLVDIETNSTELEYLMFKEYPVNIFEENYEVEENSSERVSRFFGLDRLKFMIFYSHLQTQYPCKIRPSLGSPKIVKGISMN